MVCPWWGFLLSQEAELSWDPTGHPSSQARQSELVSAAIKLLGAQLHTMLPSVPSGQHAPRKSRQRVTGRSKWL